MVVTASLWIDQLMNSGIGDLASFIILHKVTSFVTLLVSEYRHLSCSLFYFDSYVAIDSVVVDGKSGNTGSAHANWTFAGLVCGCP